MRLLIMRSHEQLVYLGEVLSIDSDVGCEKKVHTLHHEDFMLA